MHDYTNAKNIQVVLVDDEDNVLGNKEKFATHKHPVLLHRAVSVVIYDNDRRQILLQKRADGKPLWPLYWTNACCTHPTPDESYDATALRRLEEEMGFKTQLEEAFRFKYKASYDDAWGEHELDVVFVGAYEGEIKPDPEEVADYKWIYIDKLLDDVVENSQSYTPWFKIILERLHPLH